MRIVKCLEARFPVTGVHLPFRFLHWLYRLFSKAQWGKKSHWSSSRTFEGDAGVFSRLWQSLTPEQLRSSFVYDLICAYPTMMTELYLCGQILHLGVVWSSAVASLFSLCVYLDVKSRGVFGDGLHSNTVQSIWRFILYKWVVSKTLCSEIALDVVSTEMPGFVLGNKLARSPVFVPGLGMVMWSCCELTWLAQRKDMWSLFITFLFPSFLF